jgi:hypothetical protein
MVNFFKAKENKQEVNSTVELKEVMSLIDEEFTGWLSGAAKAELFALRKVLTQKEAGQEVDFNEQLSISIDEGRNAPSTSFVEIALLRFNNVKPLQYLLENKALVPSKAIFSLIDLNKDNLLTLKQFNQVFDLFLKHGININMPNENGQTPLFFAKRNYYTLAEKSLLKHGAKMKASEKLKAPFYNLRDRAMIAANVIPRKCGYW